MMIKVKLFGIFQHITGKKEVEVKLTERSVVKDVVEKLALAYGNQLKELLGESETGEIEEKVSILLNHRSIRYMEGLHTQIRDGDILLIMTPITGG